MPIALVYGQGQTLWAFADNKWADADAYAAISAYDMAGNESPRSRAVRVNAESSSCGLARGSRGRGFSISIVAAAALAASLRRLGKRFRQRS